MSEKRIIIEYSGWISVAKDDLRIQRVELNGDMVDIDTTKLTEKQVVSMLTKGDVVLASFGETYLNNTIDGEDNFTFDVED